MNPMADAHVALAAEPSMVTHQDDLNNCACSASFAASLSIFLGHFPDQPMVPGVHQLALFVALFRRASNHPQAHVVGIRRCKWTAPVKPDESLDVHIKWQEQAGQVLLQGTIRRGEVLTCQCQLDILLA